MGTATQTSQKDGEENPAAGQKDDPSTKKNATSQVDGEGEGEGAPEGEPTFTPEQKAYVEKLRKEAAGARTKHKELISKHDALTQRLSKLEGGFKKMLGVESEEEVSPEEYQQKLEEAQGYINQLETKSVLTELALENGLGREDVTYLSYLFDQAAADLAEGDEMTEEQVSAIIAEAKAKSKKAAAGASSSVDGDGKKPTPEGGGTGALSVEKFAKMSTTEKSLIFQKNPQQYNELMAEAKEKRIFV